MTDSPSPDTARRAGTAAPGASELVADMRAAVEAATRQIDGLVAELGAHRSRVDELETVVDLLLGATDAVVLVVDASGRISGLSRGSAHRLDGAAVGKPLSSVLPAPVVDQVADALGGEAEGAVEMPDGGAAARVSRLPGGGAVLVLRP